MRLMLHFTGENNHPPQLQFNRPLPGFPDLFTGSPMDKFIAMQTFVRVVEAGTFTKAADSLALPKPTVTRLVQQLEQQLTTKLLNRTTRRVTVTADGAAYYDRALRLLGELEELESSMSTAKAAPRGRLRIDVGAAVGEMLLIPALPRFYARYPDIRIDLGVSDRPVDLIGENVDCVLRAGEITEQSLVARRISEFHTILCASPAYLKRNGVPQHPDELASAPHTVINYFSHRTGQPYAWKLARDDEQAEIEGRHLLSVNNSRAGVAAGLAGLGVLMTTTFEVQDHIAAGRLQPVLLDWCSQPLPIFVVYPPNRHLSAKLRVFVDWVVEEFANSATVRHKCALPCPASAAQAWASRSAWAGRDGVSAQALVSAT
jgi:LysR family transcriptional regulator, regulator for bpeEF and oprC